ncbi:MAG: quaternary amine ABC transporter ATP-binding protein [Alphaproteobacteria bacterium]
MTKLKSDIALECKNLWKVFGTPEKTLPAAKDLPRGAAACEEFAKDVRAADGIVASGDINLEIKRGEFFVLMGLSGSGKSTLMRCMSRLTEPSAGELLLDGEDFLKKSGKALRDIRRQKMGMVFQHFGLFPHLTVEENVAFPLKVQGIDEKTRLAKAREMISIVELEGRETAFPDQLSGGQKQRVGIARSLAVDPELWFLDEPFSALDPLIRWQMQSELLRLQDRFQKTIIFVTHDFMEAVRLADRIAIMKDGMIVQVGTPEDIVLNPANDYVKEFVKEVPRTKIIKVDQLVDKISDGEPAGVVTPDMTLEDVLALTAESAQKMAVADETGKVLGELRPEKLTSALKRV